jgi:predicted dehydrogenase
VGVQIPSPTPLPDHIDSLNWGIAAPGEIAGVFASAVRHHGRQTLAAVGSRSLDRAATFAETHGIAEVCGSYEELFSSDSIDAVYVANHIDSHLDVADQALRAGKHVLVEKPMHYSPERARQTFDLARERGLFITEAMWTRYLPQTSVLRKIIQSEEFGHPEHLVATFAVDNRHIPRLWEPRSGGIVFDMGIYPIALAHDIFGRPTSVSASGRLSPTGLDEGAVVRLEYSSGAVATLIISGVATFPSQATISGEKLSVTLQHPFFVPTTLTLSDKELYETSVHWTDESAAQGHDGLYYQAEWFAHYLSEGLSESPRHTHDEIVSNLEVAREVSSQLQSHPWL